ncbi:NAD(+) diphosphatase [Dictyobacter aurantiacus]|uniref:NAD(+) diphosphatase n=1 Tax=Dictyobacter aurantiacus TaxID=1936993 RepID=A0A401ZPV1_9CHLR|nr:NAD(+) diphosphatase [Dictyobacter aurantiacus]GCE08897.1 NADH pyrophosphatase [Dictyobacter aurantiacus]
MANIESIADNTNNEFERVYPTQPIPEGQVLWFPFQGQRLMLKVGDQDAAILQGDQTLLDNIKHEEILYIGRYRGQPCLASALDPEASLPGDWKAVGLRELYNLMPGSEYNIATYASQLINWYQTSRYCPVCGSPMVPVDGGWGRSCVKGHYTGYPAVVPAIIILIHDGKRVLMAHKAGWGKRYGLIAGFVEPGETLEECVRREVKEEAGIEIEDLEYRCSQPWPFPSQLMIGFMARYKSGTVHPQDNELDDVHWFSPDTLPELPPPSSLAYMLISSWLQQYGNQQ